MMFNRRFSFEKILLVSTSLCLLPIMSVGAQELDIQELSIEDYAVELDVPEVIVMPESDVDLIANDDGLSDVLDDVTFDDATPDVEGFATDFTSDSFSDFSSDVVDEVVDEVVEDIVDIEETDFDMAPVPELVDTATIPEVASSDVIDIEDVTDQVISVTSEPTDALEELQPEPVFAEEQAGNTPDRPKNVPYSGTYYDSDSIGPSALGASAGPRKVDPLYEPGSSFVVVKKSATSASRQANIIAGQRALKLKRYSSALEIYEKLYKKNPRDAQILMGLAVAQQYSGFEESAIATYEELLKRHSGHSGAMVNLMGLLESRKPGVAVQKLRKLWDRNSQNPAVAAQLGLVSAKVGDLEASSRYLGIAASLEPQNALHYYNLAIVMDQAKSHGTAIEYYQKALEVDVAHNGGGTIPREQVYDRLAQLRRL